MHLVEVMPSLLEEDLMLVKTRTGHDGLDGGHDLEMIEAVQRTRC